MFAVTFVGIFIAGEFATHVDIYRQELEADKYISYHLRCWCT